MPKLTKNTAAIVLAAGKGERMKSAIPKVLRRICCRPMIEYVFDLLEELRISDITVVLGWGAEEMRKTLRPGMKTAIQAKQRGTADAVNKALPLLSNFKGSLLILYADNPLLKKETIKELLARHNRENFDVTLLTAQRDNPSGYGRILRDVNESICGIVEDRDADDYEKEIKEINTGIMCFKKGPLTAALKRVKPDNKKKEFYLTDTIDILCKAGFQIGAYKLGDCREALGINSQRDLTEANKIMQARINQAIMDKGVNIIAPDSTFISYAAQIGPDTTIYPFTVIERDVKIGRRCSIGPYAHIREGTRIADEAVVGNFIEVVRSKLASKTVAKHFSYLGDALIGSRVNIGAGTVTANFDGRHKNKTIIKDKAFIGSDTVLVAPVKVGRCAKTGAGSVVTRNNDVADNTVVAGVPARLLSPLPEGHGHARG